jgi:NAD(P)-dependent dehydrogenase (short-subunit alcohol dehydrogenase family)
MYECERAGKVIVIAGGLSRLARSLALHFSRQGARLVIATMRKNGFREVADTCRRTGAAGALVFRADSSRMEDAALIANRAITAFSSPSMWINCGCLEPGQGINSSQEQTAFADSCLFYGSYFALSAFRRQGYGVLLNIAPRRHGLLLPFYASYASAKKGFSMKPLLLDLKLPSSEDGHLSYLHADRELGSNFDRPLTRTIPRARLINISAGNRGRPTPSLVVPKRGKLFTMPIPAANLYQIGEQLK